MNLKLSILNINLTVSCVQTLEPSRENLRPLVDPLERVFLCSGCLMGGIVAEISGRLNRKADRRERHLQVIPS